MAQCKRVNQVLEDLFEYGYDQLDFMSQQDLEDLAKLLGYNYKGEK